MRGASGAPTRLSRPARLRNAVLPWHPSPHSVRPAGALSAQPLYSGSTVDVREGQRLEEDLERQLLLQVLQRITQNVTTDVQTIRASTHEVLEPPPRQLLL